MTNFTSQDLTLTLTKTGSQAFRLTTSTVTLPRSQQASVGSAVLAGRSRRQERLGGRETVASPCWCK